MREFSEAERIERSLTKTYKGPIFSKFLQAIDQYRLVEDGDKICVALSGGKDSLVMAKLFQIWQRASQVRFDLVFLTMDPGFLEDHLEKHLDNCKRLAIDVVVKPSKIFSVAEGMSPESPCFLCARMRRGFLYKTAKEMGCNKLALGHHFDDVVETTLMNMFYAGQFKTMMPKAKSENYEGIELIRPLYMVKEADILRFTKSNHIETMNCGCKIASCQLDSKRREMKHLVEAMRKKYVNTDINLFRAAENVNLNGVLGYYDDDSRVSFMDRYDQNTQEV
ncbi:MAG: ATP-binding protein [Candidatus Izemoplasmatales bacterium]|nr:ATP-binding protein [Candidatus Izemoplasmatales bacterium]